jgi:hypothetical protein
MRRRLGLLVASLASVAASAQTGPALVSTDTREQAAQYEALGATIGQITIIVDNVFDLSNPAEDKRLYRIANRLHITTREHVVAAILLFRSGSRFDQRVIEESERLMRAYPFISDATIRVLRYDAASNTVDVEARIHDTWSFSPDISFSRSGGQNEFGIGLDEGNLLGYGKEFAIGYDSSIDRTERLLRYIDPNVLGGRTRLDMSLANNSDGDRYRIAASRPFFALNSRRSLGAEVLDEQRIDPMYDLGEVIDEFGRERSFLDVSGGWSRGLLQGRSLRWLVGATYDSQVFSPTADVPDPLLLPPDRKLVYPWAGFQILFDDFRKLMYFNMMGRIEDIPFGLNLSLRAGYASPHYGADRAAWIFDFDARKAWEPAPGRYFFLEVGSHARYEDVGLRDSRLTTRARYFQRNLGRHLFSVGLTTLVSDHLDPDQQVLLGGDNGLRGYPVRYQAGEHRAVLNVEQRFYTNWYPWRLVQVGAAVFLDAGRTWGQDPRGSSNLGMLYDLGMGLRLVAPRSSGQRVIHVDLAFPLNADPSIDSVQLVIETKSSF